MYNWLKIHLSFPTHLQKHCHDSPLWAWSFLRRSSHSAFLPAIDFLFTFYKMVKSSLAQSFQPFFGPFSVFLIGRGCIKNSSFYSFLLNVTTCSVHLIVMNFIFFYNSYYRGTSLKTAKIFSPIFVKAHISEVQVNADLINTPYTEKIVAIFMWCLWQ